MNDFDYHEWWDRVDNFLSSLHDNSPEKQKAVERVRLLDRLLRIGDDCSD
jgi:hypothetical protein